VLVFNKVDRIDPMACQSLRRRYPEAVLISAQTGQGLPELQERLMTVLSSLMRMATIRIPGRDRRWVEQIYRHGQVLHRCDLDDGVELEARIPHHLFGRLVKAGLVKEAINREP
jgi:GTP-binding protein HflX